MFVEIAVVTDRRHAEALSDALLEAGALSASLEDADAGSTDEEALYGEPGSEPPAGGWKRSRVVALFDGETATHDDLVDPGGQDRDVIATTVTETLQRLGLPTPGAFERREIADADWVGLTQSQFSPIGIGSRLWIVPSWHALPDAARDAGSIVLRLDPGMAFGTGDHPTTRLCLAWLDEHPLAGARVTDYGCGSGILAVAAKKFGAAEVVGTDIDDQAIVAARTNAEANDVDVAFVSSATFSGSPADVVVANILSNPLKVLAPLLVGLVRPGGRLVLSGILERQWREVAAVYAPLIALDRWRSDEGWVCLVGTRAPVPEARS